MVTRRRWSELPGQALGRGEFAFLSAVGRLGDRWQPVYRADIAWSLRRLRRAVEGDVLHPTELRRAERSWFSQNGEDGVLDAVFERIGQTNRYLVEIGAADGEENCTRHLVEAGWSGVWIEGDEVAARHASERSGESVRVLNELADRETIAARLADNGVPEEPDLVVIDIDSDDRGVLEGVLARFRPRVVVVEYNAAFSPRAIWAMPKGAGWGWDGTFRHGASLGALAAVAVAAGYSLVYCDSAGVNAFFVRDDLAGAFPDAGSVTKLARPPAYLGHPFGHPRSKRAVNPTTAIEIDELRRVTIDRLDVRPLGSSSPDVVVADMTLTNGSSRWLSSGPPFAFNLSMRWLDADATLPAETGRWRLPRPIGPGRTATITYVLRRPPGPAVLRATAVVEETSWLEALGSDRTSVDVHLDGIAAT